MGVRAYYYCLCHALKRWYFIEATVKKPSAKSVPIPSSSKTVQIFVINLLPLAPSTAFHMAALTVMRTVR